jgi:hypothetical protein
MSSIFAGTAKLRRIVGEARAPGRACFSRALESLGYGAAGGSQVRILMSAACRVPFACGVARPVILFPKAASGWPAERIRAVLAHELAHVRRLDFLTRLVSRVVCSLFWFAPHLWAAHASLHVEQEKAADAFTVTAGTKPADYARHLLDLARVLQRPDPLLAGLFALGLRRSALERRVVDILRMRGGGDQGVSPRFFAPRFLRPFALCVLCALPLLFINPAFKATRRDSPVPPALALENIAGTWIREASEGASSDLCDIEKIVVDVDGKAEYWRHKTNMGPHYCGLYEVEKAWTEPDGCLYCRVRRKRTAGSVSVSTELWRLDRSGKVLEIVLISGTQDEFPEKIDPNLARSGPANYIRYTRGDSARGTAAAGGVGETPGAAAGGAGETPGAAGGMEYWARVGDLGPNGRCVFEISESWADADGFLYCRARVSSACVGSCAELWKIHPSVRVWEKAFVLGKDKEFPDGVTPTPEDSFTCCAVYTRG